MTRKGKKGASKTGEGPKLPYALAQEMGTRARTSGLQGGKRGQSMFLVSQRKEARKAARLAKKRKHPLQIKQSMAAQQPAGQSEVQQAAPAKKRRMAPIELPHPSLAVAQEHEKTVKQPKPVQTKFGSLLSELAIQGLDDTALNAEAALQRDLARKLGIRKRKRNTEEPAAITSLEGKAAEAGESEASFGEGMSDLLPEDSLDPGSGEFSVGSEADQDESDSGTDSNKVRESGSDGENIFEDKSESEIKVASQAKKNAAPGKHMKDHPSGRQASMNPSEVSNYVPPAARGRPEVASQVRRRLTGLLNRLSDANLPQIAGDVIALMHSESRRDVIDNISDVLLEAVAEGPRATDRFSAVTAAFISGSSARAEAAELGANFSARLAVTLEIAYTSGESLTSGNLTNLLAQLYACGLLSARCIYTFLERLTKRFEEQDAVLMYTLLKSCGLKLRSDDPVAMKELVLGVHSRAAECKDSMTPRTQVMLELIVDIKNNRLPKGAARVAAMEMFLSQGAQRWLKESKVSEVQLRSVTWDKLLSSSKKGMWWLPSAAELDSLAPLPQGNITGAGDWSAELLQLAAKQRMNTDVRRAVFCIIMGSEDYVDASEKLLRLPLKGEAQREIVRVAVDCCLQEAVWNPYYAALLKNVLAASQAHCVTAQFCIWDLLKDVSRQDDRRVTNLANLASQLILSKALPLSSLRVAQLDAVTTAQEGLLWQTFFKNLLLGAKNNTTLTGLLKAMAPPHLQKFAVAMASYLKEDFDTKVAGEDEHGIVLLKRSKLAQKYLSNLKRLS